MKKYLFLVLFSFIFHMAKAQNIERQVIASSAHFLENGNLSLDATLGEMAVSTLEGINDLSVSQGFHQASLVITNTYEPFANLEFQVFPNPTASSVRISTSSEENLTAQVYDLMGKILIQKELIFPIDQQDLSLQQLPAAHYFLKITDQTGNLIFTTSIQKINQ